jgi:hypothetical protein
MSHLDDFLVRATKARWSPRQILEQLAQKEERSRRSLERRLQGRLLLARLTWPNMRA